ncbi:MAG: hypothetical protein ACR2O3_05025 [Rhizobiaceae bacterium]
MNSISLVKISVNLCAASAIIAISVCGSIAATKNEVRKVEAGDQDNGKLKPDSQVRTFSVVNPNSLNNGRDEKVNKDRRELQRKKKIKLIRTAK